MNERGPVVLDALVLRSRPTGVGRSILELVQALAEQDRGLDFVVLATDPQMFRFLDHVDRWRVVACPGATGHLLRKAWYVQLRVPALCRRLGAGLLHSLQFMGPLRVDCPALVTVHDLTWHDYPETIEQPRLGYYRLMAPRVLSRSAAILANSAATGRELATAYPALADKITVTRFATPSWVWPARERCLPTGSAGGDDRAGSGKRPYFLFVSTLEPRKNLGGLVRAYEKFLSQARESGRPEVEIPDLHLIGPRGWKDGPVRDSLTRLEATGRLHRLDYRTGDDLWRRYQLARALLFPSFHEGFGFPILEAMSAETPVMTSNRGAMAEVGGDCALLVDPEDIDAMARKMATLAWDGPIVADLKRRGLDRARTWVWSETARQTCAVYHRVLDSK